jgi:hypothetical protein
MKNLLLLSVLFSASLSTNLQAQSKVVSAKEVQAIEEQIDKELQSSKLDNKKKLIATILAGREFYQYRYYDKSKKYYQAAIAIDTKENKSEAYINLMAIALVNKDKKDIQTAYDSAKKYFSDNKKYKSQEIGYYLSSIEGFLSGKNKDHVKGFYGRFVEDANLADLVKNKKYSEALSVLNPESLDPNGMNSLEFITYDVLNVNVHKKNVKKLYCAEEFKKYPDAYTYSILVCGLLNDYLTNNKFDEQRLKRAEKYFAEMDREKAYLLEVVKEIN